MIPCHGLYYYRTATQENAINVSNNGVFSMDNLDGTWNDITGTAMNSAHGVFCDFATFNGKLLLTNNVDLPQLWTGTGTMSAMTVPTNLTKAKFIENFNNYVMLANCYVSGTSYQTRVYWSAIKDDTSWTVTDLRMLR